MPVVSTAAQQELDVVLERPGREAQVADLPGEGPPVLLPAKTRSSLRWRGLGQIGAALVEEDDVDASPGRPGWYGS